MEKNTSPGDHKLYLKKRFLPSTKDVNFEMKFNSKNHVGYKIA